MQAGTATTANATTAARQCLTSHGDDLIAAHGDLAALMPYLHLPVQSGSDRILRLMNRKHGRQKYFDLIDRTFRKFGAEVVHEDGWSRSTRSTSNSRWPPAAENSSARSGLRSSGRGARRSYTGLRQELRPDLTVKHKVLPQRAFCILKPWGKMVL